MYDEFDQHLADLATYEGMPERADTATEPQRMVTYESSEIRTD